MSHCTEPTHKHKSQRTPFYDYARFYINHKILPPNAFIATNRNECGKIIKKA